MGAASIEDCFPRPNEEFLHFRVAEELGCGAFARVYLAKQESLAHRLVAIKVTTAGDVDYYKFTAGMLTNRIEIDLRAAGLSLLTGRVELLDANGNVSATALAWSHCRTEPLSPTNRHVACFTLVTAAGRAANSACPISAVG